MALTRKSPSRRREVRRQVAETRVPFWRRVRTRFALLSLLTAIGLVVAATLVIVAGSGRMPYHINQRLDRDVRARVDFAFKDEALTEDKRREARLRTPNVYIRNDALLTSIRTQLTELYTLAKSATDADSFIAAAKGKGWNINAAGYNALRSLASSATAAGVTYFDWAIANVTDYLANQYVVEKVDDPRRAGVPERSLLQASENHERRVLTSELQFISNRTTREQLAEQAARKLPTVLEPIADEVRQLILRSLNPTEGKYEPIYRYSPQATAALIQENEAQVPEQVFRFHAGDVLVHADAPIDPDEMRLIEHEHAAYIAALREGKGALWRAFLLERIGVATFVLLVVGGLSIYTAFYQPRIVMRPMRAFGLAMLLLGMLALARFSALVAWQEWAVFPVVVAAAVLTIVYEQRYAFGVTGGLAVLATFACQGDLGLFVTLLTPMAITVFLLNDIRTRGKLVATGAMAAVGATLAAAAAGFIGGQELSYVLWHAGSAGVAALLAGFIVLGVLPGIERLFGVATSLTLLEWCDASRPLLRRLAQEAPGTHSHSLVIGTIAEKTADAIGANGLLVRVGALFHDIGKIAKPQYYVENQEARINRHDRLGPTLSHLVIVAHVKDGLEMAREYGLPRILHQFIAEHHGTTVVRYFQRVAAEQAQKANQKELPESEFRYPGPKPRTRESAVLMICDSVEGAVRAMPEPTPGRIESTVHQVLMARLNDGQFDDCDITMKGLSRAEDALVKGLCAVYHGRIAYPKEDAKRAAAKNGAGKGEAGQPEGVAAAGAAPGASAYSTTEAARP